MSVATWFAIAAGGALGAVGRYATSLLAIRLLGPQFPWGTLSVNVLGSFLLGAVFVWTQKTATVSPALTAFLAIGLLGAFTTFSTFSLDAITLYRERTIIVAGGYVAASLVLSIVGLLAGMAMMRNIT